MDTPRLISDVTTTTPASTESISLIIYVLSAVIAKLGTITNVLSLSYFIMKIRSGTLRRKMDLITTKLFVALNVFDLLLSVSAILFFTSLKIYNGDASLPFCAATYTIFSACLFTTSFLTCLLAVVRAIYLIYPLHEVRWSLIEVSILVYSVAVVAILSMRVIISPDSYYFKTTNMIVHYTRFLIVAILFFVVVVSNVLTMGKLFFSQSQRDTASKGKRKATITVGIISAIYCLFNIGFVVIAGISLCSMSMYENIPIEIMDTVIYILLPLNSACNPVVYFTRRSDMRSYLKVLWKRLTELFSFRKSEITSQAKGNPLCLNQPMHASLS